MAKEASGMMGNGSSQSKGKEKNRRFQEGGLREQREAGGDLTAWCLEMLKDW